MHRVGRFSRAISLNLRQSGHARSPSTYLMSLRPLSSTTGLQLTSIPAPDARELSLRISSLTAMRQLAHITADLSYEGDTILLEGPIGCGKTEFARAFIRGYARMPQLTVPSPTFMLDVVYHTRGISIHHVDLYRLAGGSDELRSFGLQDVLGDALCVIEWPDRLGDLEPEDHVKLCLSEIDDNKDDEARQVDVTVKGKDEHLRERWITRLVEAIQTAA